MEPLEKTGPVAIFSLECSLVMRVDYMSDVELELDCDLERETVMEEKESGLRESNEGEMQVRQGKGENGCGGL